MNPVALLGTRLSSMYLTCDALKTATTLMNNNQCRRCEELTKRVIDLEKKMKQVFNGKKKGEALSQRHRDLIQQLQNENRKLNEQIRQLTLEIENIEIQTVAGLSATQPKPKTCNGVLKLATLGCYLFYLQLLVIVNHLFTFFYNYQQLRLKLSYE